MKSNRHQCNGSKLTAVTVISSCAECLLLSDHPICDRILITNSEFYPLLFLTCMQHAQHGTLHMILHSTQHTAQHNAAQCTLQCTAHCTAHCTWYCTAHCTWYCTAHSTAQCTAYCTVTITSSCAITVVIVPYCTAADGHFNNAVVNCTFDGRVTDEGQKTRYCLMWQSHKIYTTVHINYSNWYVQ